MRKLIVLAALLSVVGCGTVKQIFPGLGDDPVETAITLVQTGAELAAIEWIEPKCAANPTANICEVWSTKVKPSLATAIDVAREARDIAESGGNPAQLATASINAAIGALDQAVAIEGSQKAQDIGRHIKSALVILRNLTTV